MSAYKTYILPPILCGQPIYSSPTTPTDPADPIDPIDPIIDRDAGVQCRLEFCKPAPITIYPKKTDSIDFSQFVKGSYTVSVKIKHSTQHKKQDSAQYQGIDLGTVPSSYELSVLPHYNPYLDTSLPRGRVVVRNYAGGGQLIRVYNVKGEQIYEFCIMEESFVPLYQIVPITAVVAFCKLP
jgi:hypothetical protein